jgi:hypothetical protein
VIRPAILLFFFAATTLACASGGNQLGNRESCTLTAHDSAFVSARAVYRDCAVDRPARFISTDVHPNFRPETRPSACYFADLEFVVDSLGKPEVAGARIVRSNFDAFGNAVLETLSAWKYEPAMRDGKTVRQIVTTHQTAATMIVVTKGPMPPPGGPPSQRAPTC